MKKTLPLLLAAVLAITISCTQAAEEQTVTNPVIPGFNPDPSLCRVGEDYYLTCSSFAWYPGMPVYHSRDLVHWELISHAIDRPDMVDMTGIDDNNGIWASTIRYHEGMFYMVTNAHGCGENFLIKAADPRGPWSDPIWIRDAPGIDGSLLWEDDGKCYYVGNNWDFQEQWKAQCSIWVAELDTETGELGPRTHLTYGFASNARHTEAPHLYKIDGRYMLLLAEGGSGYNHAVTILYSDSLLGPYDPIQANPVLTSRHLGHDYPIQATGHADIVQTQNGEWWSVCLGTRHIGEFEPLGRETFLVPVEMGEDGTPFFNPGIGAVTMQVRKPDLPEWLPEAKPARCEFEGDALDLMWHCTRNPQKEFYRQEDGVLKLFLLPETASEQVSSSMLIRRVEQHRFDASCRLDFRAAAENEEAGMILHRTSLSYYALLKGEGRIRLVRRYIDTEEEIASVPYAEDAVFMKIEGRGEDIHFLYGSKENRLQEICPAQSVDVISSNEINKFNGPGVGMYATANGAQSGSVAEFGWFEYKNLQQ